ncbi:ABC transporter permease [Paenibacillus sp. YYML68]|uniref:ABC transporter permease n=1 Tax=Paenibacillus sp. YYML68 TaxID=2909250 RepID=UPI002493C842|nr:ABC transporter permease [Paenibacillus sp. YYML68]
MRQQVGQFIALVLVVAVGAFFYAGLVTYSDHLSAYTKTYFETYNLSDLNVYYEQVSSSEVTALGLVEGVGKAEGRYTVEAAQSLDGDKSTINLHSIPENNEINVPVLLAGRLPAHKHELLLDSRYAKEHQLQAGDHIQLTVNDTVVPFVIIGLGENVEYAKKNDTQNHRAFGVAYMAEEMIPVLAGHVHYNEVMIDANEGADIEQVGKAIEARSQSLPYIDQLSKERSFNYSKVSETIYNNSMMSKVIPLVLFMIEAVILFLTMSRVIDSQRYQVGIMKALGVRDRSIMLHYMGYPVLVAVVGAIVGCILASLVFVPFVTASNARSYSLPDIQFSLSIYSVLPPILISSAFGSLACYLSGRAILQERAAQALRPKPPKRMKQLLLERTVLWSRLSYSFKLIIRNLWLNRRKALASSVGVVVSTVLLITAFGTQSALLQVASQIEDVNLYDLRIDYAKGTTPELTQLPEGIAYPYVLSAIPTQLLKADEKENATLIVTDQDNSLIRFFDAEGKQLSLQHGGVLVPQSYANQYGIVEGDTIRIKLTAPEYKDRIVEMNVLGLSTQYSDPAFYGTPEYIRSLGIDYRPASLIVQAASEEDLESARIFFEQDPSVERITDQSDLQQSAQFILKQNSFLFIMFIICAVVLSFGAIYTISSINIYERSRELATLMVLGYQKSRINRLLLMENTVVTAFAVLAALPLSGYMFGFIVKALSSAHQQIPAQLNMGVLVLAVALAFFLTALSSLLLRRNVARIHMIEALKSVE